MRDEGLPLETFGALREAEFAVARTADRSVLGCMNDMTLLCEYVLADAGGLRGVDVVELNRELRRNINRPRGYRRPIDLARERTTAGS